MGQDGSCFSVAARSKLVSVLTCLLLNGYLQAPVAASTTITGCTEGELDAALAAGGTIAFNCGPNPRTILLTTMKMIGTNADIQGGGLITLSGAKGGAG